LSFAFIAKCDEGRTGLTRVKSDAVIFAGKEAKGNGQGIA
jgi:hypothetical protein